MYNFIRRIWAFLGSLWQKCTSSGILIPDKSSPTGGAPMNQDELILRRLAFLEEMLWHVIDVQQRQIDCGTDTTKVLALDADVKARTRKLKAAVEAAKPTP